MKRDVYGAMPYWNEWVAFGEESIVEAWGRVRAEPGDTCYRPQYIYDLAFKHLKLMLRRYSRGDAVSDLIQYFPGLLSAWEESERLGKEVWGDDVRHLRSSWDRNLHRYMDCFWLTGLALALDIPDGQWQRLLSLMGNEGEDVLLDRVIASRQRDRKVGGKLCFPKAYQRLLHVIDAPESEQPKLLRAYLDGWFDSLKNAGSPDEEQYLRTPYWYTYGNENFEGGAYFGRWCIEAAAVAKAFDIDDTACLDHPFYPGDLVQDGRSPRYPDPAPKFGADIDRIEFGSPAEKRPARNWLSRLLLGRDSRQ